ncbi:hypothetical protein C8R43DRAFT_1117941 [Mycena crocata]|nr:hypothetical protein C8R43DRAFT_1117941 [Mycena crocata]
MHATLPWPVSPEFENALALATQRHLEQPAAAPSPPYQHTLTEDHDFLSPDSVPRSTSLMMKTRVAVRDKTPHRFQVVPLRDATKNREKDNTKCSTKQPPAPWTRQLAVPRPTGVGLGLSVPIQCPSSADTSERGRQCTQNDVFGASAPAARKSILRGLQGSSPRRPLGSPDRKENRKPASRDDNRTPTRRGRQPRREYALDLNLDNSICTGDTTSNTIQDHVPSATFAEEKTCQAIQENTAIVHAPDFPSALSHHVTARCDTEDITVTIKQVALPQEDAPNGANPSKSTLPVARSRHFKSSSLGTIHHLLSASPSNCDVPDETPRVRCRKRTNTLSVAHRSTKRYGVYTHDKLDFSPVAPPDDARIGSTYSLGALLSAYSYDSLPSMYSQESFVAEHSTQPLRVKVRPPHTRAAVGHPHTIVLQLIREVDAAIGEWL